MAAPQFINGTWYAIENYRVDKKPRKRRHRLGSAQELGHPGKRIPNKVMQADVRFWRHYKPKHSKHIYFHELLNMFKEAYKADVKESTYKTWCMYAAHLKMFHDFNAAEMLPETCNDEIKKYFKKAKTKTKTKRKYTNRTILRVQQALDQVMVFAERRNVIDRWTRVEKVSAVPRLKEIDRYTPDQLRELFEHLKANNPYHYFCAMVLYYTGMRRFEFINLKCTDVDLKRGTIKINNEGYKFKKSRFIDIHPTIHNLLKDRLAENRENVCMLQQDSLRAAFYRLSGELGFHCSVGKFRRTFISEKLEAGISINFVADWCGNSTGTIERHYKSILETARKHTMLSDVGFSQESGQNVDKKIKRPMFNNG